MKALSFLTLIFSVAPFGQAHAGPTYRCVGVTSHDKRIIGHAEVLLIRPGYAMFCDYSDTPTTYFEMFNPKKTETGDFEYTNDFRHIVVGETNGIYHDVRIIVGDSFGECHEIPSHND